MRMKNHVILLLTACILAACGRGGHDAVVRITSAKELDSLVGQQVELVGIVSSDPVPQIHGVDVYGLERLRGQRVRAFGILQRTEYVQDGIDFGHVKDTGGEVPRAPVFRKWGTYYRLQHLKFEIYKFTNQAVQRTGASRFAELPTPPSGATGSRR